MNVTRRERECRISQDRERAVVRDYIRLDIGTLEAQISCLGRTRWCCSMLERYIKMHSFQVLLHQKPEIATHLGQQWLSRPYSIVNERRWLQINEFIVKNTCLGNSCRTEHVASSPSMGEFLSSSIGCLLRVHGPRSVSTSHR